VSTPDLDSSAGVSPPSAPFNNNTHPAQATEVPLVQALPTQWPPVRPSEVQPATSGAYVGPPPTGNPYAFQPPAYQPTGAGPTNQLYPTAGHYPAPPGYPPPPQWSRPPSYGAQPPRRGRVHPAIIIVLVLALLGGGGFAAKTYLFDHKSSGHSAAGRPLTSDQLANVALIDTDVPAGFTAQPDDPSSNTSISSDADAEAQFATCVGQRDISADQVANSDSADYALGSVQISSSARSLSNSADVATTAAQFTSPKASQCLTNSVTSTMTPDDQASIKNFVATASGRSANQPSNVIANITQTFTAISDGQSVPVYVATVMFGAGNTESEVDILSFGVPVAPSLLAAMTAKMSEKLKG
jgi:hypothetical protein